MWHLERKAELIVDFSAFRFIYIDRFVATKTMIKSFMKATLASEMKNSMP